MSKRGGVRNMTTGSPLRHILLFSLPLLAGNFLQQFYNMVDSWVVGNYVSDAALAAVGVGFPVLFLFSSLFSGIATGGTVVIAQALGAQKPEPGAGGHRHAVYRLCPGHSPHHRRSRAAGAAADGAAAGGPRRVGGDPDVSIGGLRRNYRQHRL